MPIYLDDLIKPFFVRVGDNFRNSFARGQLFFVPLGYARENLELWRPTGVDASGTSATTFQIMAAPGDRFARSTPLHQPKLETNEEFVVVRAKPRPVILLSPAPQDPGVERVRGGGRVHRRLALVVPVFNLMNRLTGEAKYQPEFIERMRLLEWPEFLYLPSWAGVLKYVGVARVAEIQAAYQPHLEPRDLRLSDEALAVLQAQLRFLTSGEYGGALAAYREELLHQ